MTSQTSASSTKFSIRQDPVVLVGMHRSGTSLFAKILADLGVFLGDRLEQHHESLFFLEQNEWILNRVHGGWDTPTNLAWLFEQPYVCDRLVEELIDRIGSEEFTQSYIGSNVDWNNPQLTWGWKDPRNTLTWFLWQRIFPDAKFIFIHRNGVDVASSLKARTDNFIQSKDRLKAQLFDLNIGRFNSLRCADLERCFQLWEEYNSIFYQQRSRYPQTPFFTLGYEDLLGDAERTLRSVLKFINLEIDESEIATVCQSINPSRRYSFLSKPDLLSFYNTVKDTSMMQQFGYNRIVEASIDSERPIISAIVPAYNAEKTIAATIQSVLNQTFQNWELLIVDDGSTDRTLEIASSFSDSRIQVISCPHRGSNPTRNAGLKQARGDYAAFLDADDLWSDDKLMAQYQALKANPNAAVAYSWNDFIDESGEVLHTGGHLVVNGNALANLLLVCFIENGSNPLILREALLDIGGFDEELNAGQDWDLYLRLAAKYEFACVPQTQVFYRQSSHSISSDIFRLEAACSKLLDRAFAGAPPELQYLKQPSYANLYKYLTHKALKPPISPAQAQAVGKYVSHIIEYDPMFRLRTELFASVLLNCAAETLIDPTQTLPSDFKPLCETDVLLKDIRLNPLPYVSVILAVRNGASTIRETVESVLAQYFLDFELIVIDDGSDDTTLDVLSQLKDYRLKVFSEPHRGQSASRNFAAAKAAGEFLAFIDADDLWTRDKLAEQLRALQDNPDAAIAYSWVDYINEAGDFLNPGCHFEFTGCVQENLLMVNFIETVSNGLIRRTAFNDVGGFDEELAAAEGWDLCLRLTQKYPIVCIPHVQVFCRMTSHTLTSDVLKFERLALKVVDRTYAQMPPSWQPWKSQTLGNLYRHLTYRTLLPPVNPEKCAAATHFITQIIANDPAHTNYKDAISAAWFNSATFAMLPTGDIAQKLKQELNWVFDPAQLLQHQRPLPYPQISIVLVAYNVEATIEQTIASILQQTFKEFELIVIEDGSTDRTKAILEGLTDYRIKLFSFPHAGRAISRDRGLERASNETAILIDTDTIWTADHLANHLQTYREEAKTRQRPFPTISVVIPVYNGAKTIRETIESVLAQTFSDIEVIVVDDGSTDRTVEVVNSIADDRIRLFSYPNGGQAASRNRGMARAWGDYYAYIDADDLWTPDKLERQLQALQDNPKAGVAYSWVDYVNEKGKYIRSGGRLQVDGPAYGHLLLTDFLENGSNPLVRQAAIEKVGTFEESLPPSEDWDLWLRLAAEYEYACVPAVQILYRVCSGSQSANVERVEASCLRVFDRAYAAKAAAQLQHLRSQSMANLYQYLTYKALENLSDPHRAKVAARFFWTIVENDQQFTQQKRLTLTLLLKTTVAAYFPKAIAKLLLPRINKLSYPTEWFTRIRAIPF
jgi:glycosyltransferase involved in cell wall biosynthesis